MDDLLADACFIVPVDPSLPVRVMAPIRHTQPNWAKVIETSLQDYIARSDQRLLERKLMRSGIVPTER